MKSLLDRTGPGVPLALFMIGLLLFLYYVGARDLWPTDEDEYAQISREMLRSGNWLLPTANGVPWTIKPVLLNWLIALIAMPFGDVSEFHARFFSAMGATGSMLLAWFLGRRIFNPRAGLIAALVLGTSVLFIQQGRWAQTYMLSTFFATLAIVCFFWGYRTPARRFVAYMTMYIATGLGVLTMGPVNLAMPGLVGLVFLLVRRDLWHIRDMMLVRGVLLFAAIAAPWYIYMSGQEAYSSDLLVKTNVTRFLDAWTHSQPWYYYLRDMLWSFAPWSAFLPGALILAFSKRSVPHREGMVMALTWFLSLLAFFSIADGKRPQYLLAAYPAMALLVGYLFDRALEHWREPFYRRAVLLPGLLLAGIFALVAVGAPLAAGNRNPDWVLPALLVSVLAAALAGALVYAWRRERPQLFVLAPVAFVLVMIVYSAHVLIPLADSEKTVRPYSEYLRSEIDRVPGTRWGMFRTYRARYIYYADAFTADLRKDEELQAFLAAPERAIVVIRARDYERLRDSLLDGTSVLDYREIGSRKLYLVSNRPPETTRMPDLPAAQDQT